MSISNNQILARPQELGWYPPIINDINRMYGFALVYNAQIEQGRDQEETGADDYQMEEVVALYKDQQRKINLILCIVKINEF